MDESWRMCMGMSTTHHFPRRKSMENSFFSTNHVNMVMPDQNLEADDFTDVFGGPPRSVLCRKLSGDFTSPASFYEEVFRPPEFTSSRSMKGGRSLPAFRIPSRGEGFYSDIFGSDDDFLRSRERSRSNSKPKSKSNSSSVLSSEELSPLRAGEDVGLSSFASKLRPINVPCRWNSTRMMAEEVEQGMPAFTSTRSFTSFYNENLFMVNEFNNVDNLMRNSSSSSSYYNYNNGFCRRASSPEIISLEPHSFRSVKISADDLEFNSPSSPASSLCQEPIDQARSVNGVRSNSMQEEEEEEEEEEQQQQQQEQEEQEDEVEDEDEDEVMSSYVIEINSDFREGTGEAVSIDEAIAWAKERYNTHCSDKEHEKGQPIKTEARPNAHESQEEVEKKSKEKVQNEISEEHIKMGLLDEDVKLWSSGKEKNIRLLLSTLHHILWPNSGWNMTPLSSLKESSQVKKAYQKARLCLHPDKQQQRGATISQKYVAEKAFTILQDAWAAFISQDVFFN